MELFSGPWFGALLSIIVMDLVLAGDNAVVIALAARTLPPDLQRKAILWGTLGAIIIRVLMTLVVVWLMTIPGLKLVGGLGLIYIAIKLLKPHEEHSSDDVSEASAKVGFLQAIKTIVIADALMGLDNVLAIAGAAKDEFALVVIGLLISIPIVVFGSSMVLKLINRYPWIIYLGAGILAYTAVSMVFGEK
ncbi:MAG: TerC family protein, partial [Saezia sp.]